MPGSAPPGMPGVPMQGVPMQGTLGGMALPDVSPVLDEAFGARHE
jgi:hypothetical protein